MWISYVDATLEVAGTKTFLNGVRTICFHTQVALNAFSIYPVHTMSTLPGNDHTTQALSSAIPENKRRPWGKG